MKIARNAFVIALTVLTLVFTMSAQTPRTEKDDRNIAPTVGTGGPPGGPTGLFTIYDGQTLRAGEFTFSAAFSNYDRDPGDVDISEVPVSFQAGLNDYIELFFTTDAYRAIKVNSQANLSAFYLPNSQLNVNGVFVTPGAIVLGNGVSAGQAVFRRTQPRVGFPFVGGASTILNFGGVIPNPTGSNGMSASSFPGIGSVYGGILPGIVFATRTVTTNGVANIVPTSFTTAPSYLPDAPFINRGYAQSAFNTFTVGAKIRFTGPDNPYGIGLIPFYRFYADRADTFRGFNQLTRGSSPGGNRGDFGLVLFGDARLASYINISANLGYIYNASVKSDLFPGGEVTLLDRPDEVLAGIGVDFPVNKYFQPIVEFRSTQYVGGRTPNAFENSPIEGLAGFRIFPTRYISLGAAYRYHFNQQDRDSFNGDSFNNIATIPGAGGGTFTTSASGVPAGFNLSNDPNGFMFSISAGRRNARKAEIPNKFANVTNLALSEASVSPPCPPGFSPKSGQPCSVDQAVDVATTAVDPEGDVLTYNYTVSGGRIVGQGANVSWDLTGAQPGTYTITAGVDDGCGVCGTTQTKTITVAACDCIEVCKCPTVSLSGPVGDAIAGEPLTFTANVSGGTGENPTFNWTVSNGTITSGQGTPSITVATTPDMAGGSLTASLEIGGVCDQCDRNFSETVRFAEKPAEPQVIKVDEFNQATPDDIKARLDPFFSELANNPTDQGYIINYGTPKEIAKREADIRKAITFRNFPVDRITFVRGGNNGSGVRTVLFRVQSGATPPSAEY